MANTRNATPETGKTADRKPAPANPGNPSARLAGYSRVKHARMGAGIAGAAAMVLMFIGTWQNIPALVQAGKWLLGIALATWTASSSAS